MASDRVDRLMTPTSPGPEGGEAVEERADAVQISAPAKLTLWLRVTGVRPDGYHELESEMVTLDLADTLMIGPGDGLSIEPQPVASDDDAPPTPASGLSAGPDNLVVRALAAVGRTARVRLIKRIPVGAGLGGGSADAAAILRWAGCNDLRIAAELGADVPFCVTGGRARVLGIGESVTALPFQDNEFTLLLPPFGVDTGAVYQAWDSLVGGGSSAMATASGNDLEAPAILVEPRLAVWRDVFAATTGVAPRLAGSGSTWFVEGGPETYGLQSGQSLRIGRVSGRVLGARTVPATPL
ncbi:MAG TPA: 4-(cytidine 5'-diphospho)-2-C-methyl-D-erythritol kinase [Acidimicrobiales bacterium]|nr:4-(cytidine 5'-diphospho)-2-C-methyl-D-erythritol kinase [Acidimicrobiales bacterium]